MRLAKYVLLGACLGAPLSAHAADIRVLCPELQEIPRLELGDRERAKMSIYLVSSGDMLDGYLIEVVLPADGRTVAKKVSDVYGELTFNALGPGVYKVYLRKPEDLTLKSSVRISEIRLEKEQ